MHATRSSLRWAAGMCFGAALLLAPLTLPAAERLESWPEYRGPGGQGIAAVTGLPGTWSEKEHVRWKTPVPGKGWSSPVIGGGVIWLTTALPIEPEGEKTAENLGKVTFKVLAISAEDGSLLKSILLEENVPAVATHTLNTLASPTPVLSGDRLICHFGTMGTYCVDTRTGKILWRKSLKVDHQVGPGSSPVVYENLVVITCDGIDHQFVAALDLETGKEIWRTPRPPLTGEATDTRKAFSTPLVVAIDGRDQMIIPGAQWLVSYEPLTGKELWRLRHGEGFSMSCRPVFAKGLLYFSTGFSNPELWAVKIPSATGANTPNEVSESAVVWRSKQQIPTMSSPVIVEDGVYLVSDNGVATCLDAGTGDLRWRSRLGGGFSASLLAGDGKIYFCNREGETTVVAPGTKYKKLAANTLSGQLMASPAIYGKALILRTDSHLYCIEER